MFSNNDLNLMAIMGNLVLKKTKAAHLVVEKADQAINDALALPEKQPGFDYVAAVWRSISNYSRIGQMFLKSRKHFAAGPTSRPSGTAGFEASKRKALDRASSWSVPKTSRVGNQGAYLGVVRRQSLPPIEPLRTCGELQPAGEQGTHAGQEKSAVSSTASEEHPAREVAGVCR